MESKGYKMNIRNMKYIFLTLIIFATGCAARFGEDWSKADTTRQLTYTALHVADWGTTLDIKNHDDLYERNPTLGKHPSRKKINLMVGGSLIIQTIIPPMLNPRARKWYQYIWIGIEGAAVCNNYSVGLKSNF